MVEHLKILILEDLPSDAELAARELKKALGVCEIRLVETRKDFLKALDEFSADLIISDYVLPCFDGMSALKLALEQVPEVPFIILTGSINEDTAVKCMKAGAWDYVLKEHVQRLGLAAKSALERKNFLLEQKRQEQASREMEKKLQQAQKMEALGTLAGGIAHDFNNILGAITGYTELTLSLLDATGKAYSNLQKVMQASYRASDLVKQILTFSRQTEEEKKPLHMNLVIKEALKLLKSTLPANIAIIEEIEQKLPKVVADPTQIHQVIMNLCTNAGQAMEAEGGILKVELNKICLNARSAASYPGLKHGTYLQLIVNDTGPGIEPEKKELIFEPYFTTKKRGKGTGLGLAIVHSIVQNIHGWISVYSQPGQGATFQVLFPAFSGNEQEETKIIQDELIQGKGHILFVDDELALLEIGKLILEKIGYTVETKASSLKALELFKSKPKHFDAVITDQTMPEMTGDKLAAEMLRIRPDLPIILCTGYTNVISKEQAGQLGIRDFLTKPILQKDLARILARALPTS